MPTITRHSLYEQVWTTPLRDLAKQFGLSDVGLAKICKRLNVPRPPPGHWVRVLHRRDVTRPPLPPLGPGIPEHVVVDAQPRSDRVGPRVPRPAKPVIVVSDKLVDPHPAVRQLVGLLKSQKDELRMIPYPGQATLRLSAAQQDRALGILDAVCRGLVTEGYRVGLSGLPNDRHSHALVVSSGEHAFRVSILERQAQIEHVLTADEKARLARYGSSWANKYDHKPSGELTLQFLNVHSSYTSYGRWKDGASKLETKLGDAARRVPEIFEEIEAEDRRRAEQARLEQVAARERGRDHERERHDKELRSDLSEMIERWEQARRIREFIDAAEPAVLSIERGDGSGGRAWIAWARAYADSIDPVGAPGSIAKVLCP